MPICLRSAILAIGLLALVFSFSRESLAANDMFAKDPAELTASLKAARAGDVVLKSGNWPNIQISVRNGGEFGKPVEIRAERPGHVVFIGSSSLEINARYVTVSGLLFNKGALGRGSVIQFNSHHGIVRDTAIINYNPASFETAY